MEPTDRPPDQNPPSPSHRSVSRFARLLPRDPASSSAGADHLTVLAHELGNILDGSLRCLGLAERALPEPACEPGEDEARRKLETVRRALHRMAEMVDAAMRASSGARTILPAAPIELGEAIFHAVDVLTPIADEQGITIRACVSNGLAGVPAGALYPVIVNGLTNAIEAVGAAGRPAPGSPAGSVEVSADWTEDGRVRVTIRDDGIGLPNGVTDAIYRYGFSTKPNGSGLGLAVARAIVDELPEGSLRLFGRADRAGAGRPGAVFEVMFRPTPRSGAA